MFPAWLFYLKKGLAASVCDVIFRCPFRPTPLLLSNCREGKFYRPDDCDMKELFKKPPDTIRCCFAFGAQSGF